MKKKYIMVVSLLAFIALVVGLTCYIVNDYNYKIEKNKIAVAKEKVELAKSTKSTDDINEAKKLIGEVDTEEVKEELTIFISNLEVDIEKENIKNEFMNLLDTIEKEYNETSLNEVIQKLESIKYEDVKNSLLEKCNSVREKINAEKERIANLSYANRMKEIDAKGVISTPKGNAEVLEVVTGKVTSYTPYCSDGCQGYTASGKYVGNGDIYQYDPEYGMVHIVAGDRSYPFGTIVKLKNLNYFGEEIYAIVLDRGGAIGKDRRVLFDLLFASEDTARNFGVEYNVECEILRFGY